MLSLFRDIVDGSFSGTSGSFGVPVEKDDKRPALDLGALDSYALERWEACYLCWIADMLPTHPVIRPFSIIWFHLAPASFHPNPRRVSFIFFSAVA